MEEYKTAEFFDRLFLFEHNKRASNQYPIHKKLSNSFGYNDVYEYVIATEKIKNRTILDAGCGVGYGSTLLARSGAKKVEGISISRFEIDQAIKTQEHQNLSFEVASFKDVKEGYYDLIICVESLKHSVNFQEDYTRLLEGLKRKGKLIIIDDFYVGNKDKLLSTLMNKWELNFVLKEENLEVTTESYKMTSVDLTHFVKKRLLWELKLIRFLSRWFMSKKVHKIFEGGWVLEALYRQELMNYKLICIEKDE